MPVRDNASLLVSHPHLLDRAFDISGRNGLFCTLHTRVEHNLGQLVLSMAKIKAVMSLPINVVGDGTSAFRWQPYRDKYPCYWSHVYCSDTDQFH